MRLGAVQKVQCCDCKNNHFFSFLLHFPCIFASFFRGDIIKIAVRDVVPVYEGTRKPDENGSRYDIEKKMHLQAKVHLFYERILFVPNTYPGIRIVWILFFIKNILFR